jgi:hypothetical protein
MAGPNRQSPSAQGSPRAYSPSEQRSDHKRLCPTRNDIPQARNRNRRRWFRATAERTICGAEVGTMRTDPQGLRDRYAQTAIWRICAQPVTAPRPSRDHRGMKLYCPVGMFRPASPPHPSRPPAVFYCELAGTETDAIAETSPATSLDWNSSVIASEPTGTGPV